MTKVYEVANAAGQIATVEARSEFSAIAKAHRKIVGGSATSADVTWHGLHAECKGHNYRKPVVIWA